MASENPLDMIQGKFKELENKVSIFKKRQPPPLMCLIDGLQGSAQGTLVGVASFWLNKNMASMQTQDPNMAPEMRAQVEKMQSLQPKTVVASVRNFMVLFGVQATLTSAFKHYRKEDDIYNTVGPALGAGLAFGLVSGQPSQAPAMALGFALFSGLFYKIGEWTGTDSKSGDAPKDMRFVNSHLLLSNMGLEKYHKNLRNCALADDTIMLWNDSALQEAKIPAGPRLLILYHLDQVRTNKGGNVNHVLAPAYPIELPAGHK